MNYLTLCLFHLSPFIILSISAWTTHPRVKNYNPVTKNKSKHVFETQKCPKRLFFVLRSKIKVTRKLLGDKAYRLIEISIYIKYDNQMVKDKTVIKQKREKEITSHKQNEK